MHVVFMPYGKRSEVELLLRDMEAQKHYLPFKDGRGVWINGAIRVLPFGVYEYVFPKENLDLVLHTLIDAKDRYGLGKIVLTFLRKFIRCKEIPIYKTDTYYLWIKDNVNVIPIGIREDGEILDPLVEATHEAI